VVILSTRIGTNLDLTYRNESEVVNDTIIANQHSEPTTIEPNTEIGTGDEGEDVFGVSTSAGDAQSSAGVDENGAFANASTGD